MNEKKNLEKAISKVKNNKEVKIRFACITEVQLLYILILGQTCLVVLVAKHPILYIAALFCYIPL